MITDDDYEHATQWNIINGKVFLLQRAKMTRKQSQMKFANPQEKGLQLLE